MGGAGDALSGAATPADWGSRIRTRGGARAPAARGPRVSERDPLDRTVSTLLIRDAGPLTTVQDLGRAGYLRVGIPGSGPMDEEAFVLGNRLVGNPDGAAGLECTLIGPRLEFADDAVTRILIGGDAVRLCQPCKQTRIRGRRQRQTVGAKLHDPLVAVHRRPLNRV